MGSPSEDSFTDIYRRFFSPEEDAEEEEAVTSACTFMIQALEHVRPSPPPRPILRRTYILRDREAANERLMEDYFDATPVHGPNVFRRRFRMSQRLFLRINNDLENKYDFFKQRMDAREYLDFTSIQKVTSALRILSYGNTYDINDEYLKMAEKTTRDCLEHFYYEASPLLESYISGTIRKADFHANGNDYEHGYYLGHGIYPEYSIIVKTFSETNPYRMWHKDRIRMTMYACIILHNMIIEEDGRTICQNYIPEHLVEGTQATMEERLADAQLLRSKEIHNTLKADLVEHAWAIRPIRYKSDDEEDSEEEEVEESEDGNFEDVGLDAGENEEEE
ncbi:uncharacterized protein LOC110888752 [Helianthus annuus]|uniref:uncharacterized protein LOC110888752 n=1 Tax=Helianthus annuus TaxID=4232 RepID=UPI000B8FC242|nr:uncharacterized protein LOC110888752 [Helianthus annuus]